MFELIVKSAKIRAEEKKSTEFFQLCKKYEEKLNNFNNGTDELAFTR